jgi:hypothetical protein
MSSNTCLRIHVFYLEVSDSRINESDIDVLQFIPIPLDSLEGQFGIEMDG